jgi:hypothetical protein
MEGERFSLPPEVQASVLHAPEASFQPNDEGQKLAIRAGEAEVTCSLSSWGLVDETPSNVMILPGPVAFVRTAVNPITVAAGEATNVECEAWDAYSNLVPAAVLSIEAMPSDPSHSVSGSSLIVERAGRYDVSCSSAGAEVEPATLVVGSNLPASLMVSAFPALDVYRPGQVIELVSAVADRFGNPVEDADMEYIVPVGGTHTGAGRVVFDADGVYTVRVQVAGETEGGAELSQELSIRVDGTGPSLDCVEPLNGQMLDRTPGRMLFRGRVSDLSVISEVRVDGSPVTVAADGTFSAMVDAAYGINTVRLSGVDSGGVEDTALCSFLLSDSWGDEAEGIGSPVSFAVRQQAVDDSSRAGATTSLGDLLHTAINSAGLASSLDSALRAANPLKPSSCDVDTWFGCTFRSRIDYEGNDLRGPNTVGLSLRTNGMRVVVRMENIRVRLRVSGTLDNTGWVTLSFLQVAANFNVELRGGRPRVTVDRASVSTSVGSVSTDFSGFSGWFIDEIVVPLAQGLIRDTIRDSIRDYVRDELAGLLDGVVGGLDISSLGSTFAVPRLSGVGSLPVSFGVGFSSLATNSTRMLVGLRTRFTTPAAHARTSLGIPYEGSAATRDSTESGAVVASVHSEVFNHVMHTLWRGGLFDGPISVDSLGGLPDGIRATSELLLPPVVRFQSGAEATVSLGAMNLTLEYPGIFPTPVTISLSAEASAPASLVGDDLEFGSVTVDGLAFAVEGINVDTETQRVLERVLTAIVQQVLDDSLNAALPALPIPSFSLPASVGSFGLPAGRELGLVSPAFSTTSSHALLRGNLGIR